MKKLYLFQGVTLFAVTVLFSGCSTTPTGTSTATPRFHEEAIADVVVEFPGWQAIAITKPNTDEGGFRNFFTRAEVETKLAKLPVRHGLAVVAYRFNYSEKEQAEHQQAWSAVFKKLGFQRLVFVRSNSDRKVDGSPILKDLSLTASAATAGGAGFADSSRLSQ